MAGKFAALWPTDPKFSALEDLNHFLTLSKVQEASSILRVGFVHSKYPYYETLCKWGDFERVKTTLKIMLACWFLMCFLKRFRSFDAENLGSVGQRAAKLPAIKLWEWFHFARVRTWADWFERGRGRQADFFLRPLTLTASNFAAL